MSKNLKKAMVGVMAPLIAAAAATSTPLYDYGFGTRHPRATTAEENSFIEKQGYCSHAPKTPEERYKQKIKRQQLKSRKHKGHKHGGARK